MACASSPTLPYHALPPNDDGSHITTTGCSPVIVTAYFVIAIPNCEPDGGGGVALQGQMLQHDLAVTSLHHVHLTVRIRRHWGPDLGCAPLTHSCKHVTGSGESLPGTRTPSHAQPPSGRKAGQLLRTVFMFVGCWIGYGEWVIRLR